MTRLMDAMEKKLNKGFTYCLKLAVRWYHDGLATEEEAKELMDAIERHFG